MYKQKEKKCALKCVTMMNKLHNNLQFKGGIGFNLGACIYEESAGQNCSENMMKTYKKYCSKS